MILLVDNYDSFTYNLAQIIGTKTSLVVLRNDDERLYTIANRANGIIFPQVLDNPIRLVRWKT
jgi:anthranilate synthase component II